jgi:8-oxo-dGTP diphosphatase
MTHTYEYPHPSVTVDCVVFGLSAEGAGLGVLLIRRKDDPFAGRLALPGGFVEIDEDLEDAAARELKEETGAEVQHLEQLYTFGKPGRDPRERVISVSYFALVRSGDHAVKGGSDASEAVWVPLADAFGMELAFDHYKILTMAYERLKAKLLYEPLCFDLLPEKFTFAQVQDVYEAVLQVRFDKRNFRRQFYRLDILVEAGWQEGVSHRPGALYSFDRGAFVPGGFQIQGGA